jgi:hypothetical protein
MNETKVREIGVTPAQEQRKQDAIAVLEELLGEAKEGKGFETVFVVAVQAEHGNIRYRWPAGGSTFDLVARLEALKHELLADVHEGLEEQ